MTIKKLIIENFKGISKREEFDIRPITLFCGPNSSGKSSCLHALAALSQTTKLSASNMPIVLDDEYSHVHLGRFMDVIHEKTSEGSFSIGVEFECNFSVYKKTKNDEIKKSTKKENVKTEFSFKAKPHTQEIYLDRNEINTKDKKIIFNRLNEKGEYSVSVNGTLKKLEATDNGSTKFSIEVRPSFTEDSDREQFFQIYLLTQEITQTLNNNLRQTYYLGPFRQGPLRKYFTRGSQPIEVGAAGESAMTMLSNECIKPQTLHPNLEKVSNWISKLGLGKKVDISHLGQTDLVDVTLTLLDDAKLSLPDLGFGVSQVLPVLVQCAFAPKGSTLLFEQPELHLHDNAARNLAGVFVDFVKEKSSQIILETHSRHLFHELIQEVNKGRIKASDIVLYDVVRKDGSSSFRKISLEVDEQGQCEVDHPWGNSL